MYVGISFSLRFQCPGFECEQTEDTRLQNGARTQNAADLRQRLNYNLGSTAPNQGYPVAITTNGDVVGMSDLHGNGVPMVRRDTQGVAPSPHNSAGKMNGVCVLGLGLLLLNCSVMTYSVLEKKKKSGLGWGRVIYVIMIVYKVAVIVCEHGCECVSMCVWIGVCV